MFFFDLGYETYNRFKIFKQLNVKRNTIHIYRVNCNFFRNNRSSGNSNRQANLGRTSVIDDKRSQMGTVNRPLILFKDFHSDINNGFTLLLNSMNGRSRCASTRRHSMTQCQVTHHCYCFNTNILNIVL